MGGVFPVICSAGPIISEASIGFENRYRVGHWVPIRVVIQSDSESTVRLDLVLPDGEGVESITRAGEFAIANGATTIFGYAKTGRVDGYLEVRLRDVSDGSLLTSKRISAEKMPNAVLGSQQLVLTLGSDVGMDAALAMRASDRDQETVHAMIDDASLLPDNWLGYEGVNLVMISGSRLGIANELSPRQIEALDRWIRMGGRLIFSSGASAKETLAGDSPFARWAPGTFDRIQNQRSTTGIENYVGNPKQRLDSLIAEGELNFQIPLSRFSDLEGKIETSEGYGADASPSIVRKSHGFGQVIFIAFDLDVPPVSKWEDGRKVLLGRLLNLALGEPPTSDSEQSFDLSQVGYDDLLGQMRAALDQFSTVRLVPFSWIAMLVGVYILLIGPLDYLILRRMGRRFGWTWLTFPLFVLAGCAMAASLTQTWKGQQIRINQVDLVDIDAKSGLARGTIWSHIFSPTSTKYDLAIKPRPVIALKGSLDGAMLTWHGLPGDSFGGMNTTRLDQSDRLYQIECSFSPTAKQTASLAGLPIDVYSSRSLHGTFWGQVETLEGHDLTAGTENQLDGIVYNPLDVPLRDCLLVYDRWAYPLPSINAKGTARLDRNSKPKNITSLMTRKLVDEDFKLPSQAWRRDDRDLPRIMEMLNYYEAAGGFDYTSLLHRFQSEVDVSVHLTQGRAVLVGKTDEPACDIGKVANAHVQQTTYYRIFFPVTPRRRSPR